MSRGRSRGQREDLETRQVILSTTSRRGCGDGRAVNVIQGEPSKSIVFAPLIRAGKVLGRISLQNLDRTDAFSESDIRLLMTLVSSLSVALENARLFDETQRLLAKPTSAPPSWRSSTASRKASPRSSTCRRCTTSSASGSGRSSIPFGRHRDLRRRGRHDHLRVLDRAWCQVPVDDLRDRRVRPDRAGDPPGAPRQRCRGLVRGARRPEVGADGRAGQVGPLRSAHRR